MGLKGRWGCEADLGPAMDEPRETIWRLADRPWPRPGREAVEPAVLVAWLSTELTEPIDTMDTDLLWLWPLLGCVSGGWNGGVHGTEPARLREVFAGALMDELGRWPRRGADVDVVGGGASRLEAWWMAARDWGGGRN